MWKLVDENTPKDRLIIIYAPAKEGLNELVCLCLWHESAGFCVDEIRQPMYWMEFERPEMEDLGVKVP